MIFIFVIALIALFVGVLVYMDGANIEKIENFLQQQQCKTIDYTNGVYQAICSDKVIVMENGFSIDLGDAKMVYYKTLQDIQVGNKELILKSHQDVTLKFKDEASTKEFLNKLEEQRNK